MSICDDVLASLRKNAAGDWECQSVAPDSILVSSPNQYGDGDHVELLVKRAGTDWLVTDGGEAMARLDSAGVSVESGRVRELWRSLVRAHELEERDGRLILRGTGAQVAWLVTNMASALANIDGLRLLAPPPRAPRFDERLVTFLQSEFEFVEAHPQVRGKTGATLRPTAAAGDRARPVYLQAVAGNNLQARQRAVEHCLAMFFDINGELRDYQKLAVLGGDSKNWRPEQVRLLTNVAYVGSWNSRERLVRFIHRQYVSRERNLLDREEQLLLGGTSQDSE